ADGRMTGVDESAPALNPTLYRKSSKYLRLARWMSRYHRTRVEGKPPDGQCIYVTHHGAGYLSGDLAIAIYHLAWSDWFEHGGAARPLAVAAVQGNPLERAVPGIARLKRDIGLIDPSERSCLQALGEGRQLLLTPGGRRESTPRARHYRLRWNDRYGFARLAVRTGVPVVPLATVGGFAAYPGFTLGRLSFWSPVPLPVRLDIGIGTPIAVARDPDHARDVAVLKPVQERVRQATQDLYDRLLARRRGGA
ncbi:MAG: lysophospholipid acyltransferase family protein, partial [Gemmatimonadaceae bacterium]